MRREDWWSQELGVHVRKLRNIKIRSPHSQTAAIWRMHEHAHSNLHTYPKYTRLSCLYFLLLISPWSRIILRICSGGMSSFWASTNPNFLFSENLLDCNCCHFCAAKLIAMLMDNEHYPFPPWQFHHYVRLFTTLNVLHDTIRMKKTKDGLMGIVIFCQTYIQGVTGGTDQTSGGCSLC